MARAALSWALLLALAASHHFTPAAARSTPARAYVSSSASSSKPGSKQPRSWSIGDILVASHNEVGFPRVDVLDPSDLSVKNSVDLVPACSGQSKTWGMAFSPRYSTLKLQLAVSCAPDQADSQDGKVVVLAAKQAQHPVLQTLAVARPGASVYDRGGAFFVFGKQQQQQQQAAAPLPANSSTALAASAAAAGPVDSPLAAFNGSIKGNVSSSAASAAAVKPKAQQGSDHISPTVLFKLDAPAKGAAAPASPTPQVAAVMPSWVPSSEELAMDLGPRGRLLHYTLGKNMLRTYDTASGLHLSDRQLPAGGCSAVLAQFDGSLLVACSKCVYHLPASVSAPPLKHACLAELPAPFGHHMALDPTGTRLLASTVDGSLHSIQLSDLQRVQHTTLPGRVIGGVAVLGTVPASQQDCTPGTGCCPYGRLLSKGTTCRKATTECCEEATCDGVSPMCPDNPVKTLGTICRHPGPRSPCEQPATCDGETDKCPPSLVMANGTRCLSGPSDNVCAAAGQCDGLTGRCHVADTQQTDGNMCAWTPEDAFNVFHKETAADRTARIAAATASLTPALQQLSPHIQQFAAGALRSWAKRSGRALLGTTSISAAAARGRPLAVCGGHCKDSKCVMSVGAKGCCILPGSRLDGDAGGEEEEEEAAGGWSGPEEAGTKHRKQQRGTEEDLYCWD